MNIFKTLRAAIFRPISATEAFEVASAVESKTRDSNTKASNRLYNKELARVSKAIARAAASGQFSTFVRLGGEACRETVGRVAVELRCRGFSARLGVIPYTTEVRDLTVSWYSTQEGD